MQNVAQDAISYMVKDVASRIEAVKDASPSVLLEALSAEYFKNRSSLALYAGLALISGEMEGGIESLSKDLDFTLTSPALNSLRGEFFSAGFGDVDRFSEEGIILAYDTYFPGAGSVEYRDRTYKDNHLERINENDLLLRVTPLSRKVELEVTTYTAGERHINISHEALFTVTATGEDEIIMGPNVYFKDNKTGLLYKDEEEMKAWLNLLQILREPAVVKEKTNQKRVPPGGPDIYGFM